MDGAARETRWMYGPIPDLLIGCGGLYAVGFAFLLLAGESLTASWVGYLLPLAVLFVSVPHYGGTLVRVYGSRDQTRRYAVFTIYITVALLAWFAVGTWSALVGSLMITLYLSWSTWHYSGQNYGIALMFLARAGVDVTPRTKTALWLSFILSFGLTLLNLHSARAAAYPVRGVADGSLAFLPVGLSPAIVDPAFALVAGAYLVSLAVAYGSLARRASLRALLPATAIVFSQALWFVVPYGAIQWMELTARSNANVVLQNAILWVAIAHAAQYLWITSYYAKSGGEWKGQLHYFTKVFVFSSVAWTVPVLLFAPFALGGATYSQGLGLLLAALVNLHHFILDGAIWKLRNTRIARVLIRSEADEADSPLLAGTGFGRLGAHALVATALACGAIQIFYVVSDNVLLPEMLQRGNARVASMLLDRGGWIGVGTSRSRVQLGELLKSEGRREDAMVEFARAIEMHEPSPVAHFELGRMLVDDDELGEGIAHLRRAVELRPNYAAARRHLDYALTLAGARDRAERARSRDG